MIESQAAFRFDFCIIEQQRENREEAKWFQFLNNHKPRTASQLNVNRHCTELTSGIQNFDMLDQYLSNRDMAMWIRRP